ncbi:MAG: SoxR reducing system RseC family protein [Desulfosalsimonadaceae bacterium]|nr:SoxR reducing system RseC family protein [Desulfosalsimonadaceae bacterium]
MAIEEGVIIKVNGTTAVLRTRQKTACESCSERKHCHTSGNDKEMEVEAINTVNAQVGDRVVVSFDSGRLFLLAFFLYVFPIILMIIGALIGERVAAAYGGNPSAYSALFGFGFFFVSMGIVKWKDHQARKTGKFRPEIIRINNNRPACPTDRS